MHSDHVRGPGRASVLLLSFFGVCPVDVVDPSALASQPRPKRVRARMLPPFFSFLHSKHNGIRDSKPVARKETRTLAVSRPQLHSNQTVDIRRSQ